jgi:hypothetical protein
LEQLFGDYFGDKLTPAELEFLVLDVSVSLSQRAASRPFWAPGESTSSRA